MARGTLNIRISASERRELKMKAGIRGMSLGEYIRSKVLAGDPDQEQRIRALESKIGK